MQYCIEDLETHTRYSQNEYENVFAASIYNISDEKLESVFSTPNTSSTTSSSSEENTDEEINYFAIG